MPIGCHGGTSLPIIFCEERDVRLHELRDLLDPLRLKLDRLSDELDVVLETERAMQASTRGSGGKQNAVSGSADRRGLCGLHPDTTPSI